MKIKILAVLAVVTVVTVSMFMREKREDPSSLMMMECRSVGNRGGHFTCYVFWLWFSGLSQ